MSVPNPDPQAVAVAVKGLSVGGAGSWATFLAVMGAIGMLFRAGLIDALKEWNRSRKEKRDEDREDEVGLTARVEAVEKRAATAERRLGFVMSACTTLLTALEQAEPHNPALVHARNQLALAAGTSEDPFADMFKKLGEIPPVDRSPNT